MRGADTLVKHWRGDRGKEGSQQGDVSKPETTVSDWNLTLQRNSGKSCKRHASEVSHQRDERSGVLIHQFPSGLGRGYCSQGCEFPGSLESRAEGTSMVWKKLSGTEVQTSAVRRVESTREQKVQREWTAAATAPFK